MHSFARECRSEERFFNKYLLAVHGWSTSKKTIQAVRFVKYFINRKGGEKNVKVSKPMLTECLLSCQRWKEDLRLETDERKRGRSEIESRTQKEMREGRTKGRETDNTWHWNHLRENQGGWWIVEIWSRTIGRLTQTIVIDKVKLKAANAQISTGMKRKGEPEKELKHLNSKLQKLDWFFLSKPFFFVDILFYSVFWFAN